jgi:hypothetical protein
MAATATSWTVVSTAPQPLRAHARRAAAGRTGSGCPAALSGFRTSRTGVVVRIPDRPELRRLAQRCAGPLALGFQLIKPIEAGSYRPRDACHNSLGQWRAPRQSEAEREGEVVLVGA